MTAVRWAIWQPDEAGLHMLSHSIGTFRHFFGPGACYLVCTDRPAQVRAALPAWCEIVPFGEGDLFDDPAATWRKWAPHPRLVPQDTEIRVDSDVFLLGEPDELLAFSAGDAGSDVAITQEWFTAAWPYGNFAAWLSEIRPLQAGLVAQRPGVDITGRLMAAYTIWEQRVPRDRILGHDEQGAVAWALAPLIDEGRVTLLPQERYRVVWPGGEDASVWTTDGLVMLHATSPGHPAFHRFIDQVASVSGVPVHWG